ncbi:MAG: acyl-ACP--UDP-N-acetylglucosamine O-acyltransferase [Cellvibrionaceae bacterium]|nr:acyl-ACP--UDP-N-acetylglucosamine O-acyltransferase [Cellvibrionaceae bacterium]MCV6625498.1 acyl-ACP--UDP-N-acetylglucosamine O-acyltransferase [Cellvibrionaceae bacterium]
MSDPSFIDPRAIIDPSAELAEDVQVGPWSVIGPGVQIGAGTIIHSHVIIKGPTQIGANNRIFQFSSVGEDTPDLKYNGEPTTLVIGDNNTIREGVTIHRGTVQDRGETRIGSNNLIMAYAHIGHDCVLGDNIIMINNASVAGHVLVGDWAILGGYSLVHQFCRIGEHSFLGMAAGVGKDVPAYVMVAGAPASARSINAEGLRRRGFSKPEISAINKAFKLVYRRGLTTDEAIAELQQLLPNCEKIRPLLESLQQSTRGITR